MTQIYRQLARYLDALPAGYPATETGVEIEILKMLFTEEEAALALQLTLLGEEARVIAYRARRDKEETSAILESMVEKGLISGSYPQDKPPRYAISQYVIGFHEGQVDRLSEEYVNLFQQYVPHLFEKGPWSKVPQLRTIPINEAIPVTTEVMPYESAEGILRSKTHFAVRNCVCRQEGQIAGGGCERPMESCLVFDESALNDAATGMGRLITLEEALTKVSEARAAGLVLQPANSQNPMVICTCCSCCCGVLRHIKNYPEPAALVANPFIAHYHAEACIGCGECVEVCPMGAIHWVDENMQDSIDFNPLQCIGCGLCVGVCPTQAVVMKRKSEQSIPSIPRNTVSTYFRMAQMRGLKHFLLLTKMAVQSVFFRIIAPR